MKYYLHKPTGWKYYIDPGCPVFLIPVNGSGWKIPASLAVFGGQQDWVEIVQESLAVDEKGSLILTGNV